MVFVGGGPVNKHSALWAEGWTLLKVPDIPVVYC